MISDANMIEANRDMIQANTKTIMRNIDILGQHSKLIGTNTGLIGTNLKLIKEVRSLTLWLIFGVIASVLMSAVVFSKTFLWGG